MASIIDKLESLLVDLAIVGWPLATVLIVLVFGWPVLKLLRSLVDRLEGIDSKYGKLRFAKPEDRASLVVAPDFLMRIQSGSESNEENRKLLSHAYWLGNNTVYPALAALNGNIPEAQEELRCAIEHAESMGIGDSVLNELRTLKRSNLSNPDEVKDFAERLVALSFRVGHFIMGQQ